MEYFGASTKIYEIHLNTKNKILTDIKYNKLIIKNLQLIIKIVYSVFDPLYAIEKFFTTSNHLEIKHLICFYSITVHKMTLELTPNYICLGLATQLSFHALNPNHYRNIEK